MSAAVDVCVAVHPREHLDKLCRARPGRNAPARQHRAWHEQLVPLWEQMAAVEPVLADTARRLPDFHRSEATRLAGVDPEMPDDADW